MRVIDLKETAIKAAKEVRNSLRRLVEIALQQAGSFTEVKKFKAALRSLLDRKKEIDKATAHYQRSKSEEVKAEVLKKLISFLDDSSVSLWSWEANGEGVDHIRRQASLKYNLMEFLDASYQLLSWCSILSSVSELVGNEHHRFLRLTQLCCYLERLGGIVHPYFLELLNFAKDQAKAGVGVYYNLMGRSLFISPEQNSFEAQLWIGHLHELPLREFKLAIQPLTAYAVREPASDYGQVLGNSLSYVIEKLRFSVDDGKDEGKGDVEIKIRVVDSIKKLLLRRLESQDFVNPGSITLG